MQRQRRFTGLAMLFPLLLAALILLPTAVGAQDEPQVTWKTYDVTVVVNADGSLRITESIVIDFNGSFRQGERTIPLDRIESIDDVEVAVGTGDTEPTPSTPSVRSVLMDPGTFRSGRSGSDFVIDYGFDQTSTDRSDSIRTVVISYTAHGAIRDYPDAEPAEQQVRWTAISSDVTETGPVESGSLTIVFPENVPQDRLAIDPAPTSVEPDRVTWEREDFGSGSALRGAVAFPPITAATAPAWQANADTLEGRQEHLGAINLVIGLLALVTWVITILFMTVRGVRDPEVGLVADIIPNRPDDLPAPLVGTLVDESVDTKDVLAGLLDLERQGFVRIFESGKKRKKEAYRIELLRPLSEANAWDKPMLEGLFGKDASFGKEMDLRSSMKDLRMKSLSGISKAYEEELFARGYFLERPHTTRMRWVGILFGIFAAIGIVLAGFAIWAESVSGWIAVPVTFSVIGLVTGLILSTKAAVKTTEGAIEAKKWNAYGRYVKDLRKGPVPERFIAELEQNLPWAVALGFDSSWSDLAKDMNAPGDMGNSRRRRSMTPLLGDVGSSAASGSFGSSGASGSRSGGGGGGGLQGASTSMLAAIGGGSAGMLAMLNDAAAGFNEGASSGSGGGGGFSGSSSVGSSGGGGHSFS